MKAGRRLQGLLYAGPVLLLAFALRVYRLDGQSLWYDEGNSALMTARSFQDIIAGAAADIHPPLYYVLLSWWSRLGGTNEFGLRFLSVVSGVLLVAVLFALGKKLFARQVGLAAAGVASVSPFLVYYSQEVRMYMPGALLCTLAGLFFIKAIEKDRYWAGYALTAAAAMYTQYYAFGVILALNVFFVLAIMWRSGRGLWARWLAANLVAVLLYLPWLPSLINQAALWPRAAQAGAAESDLTYWIVRGVLAIGVGPIDIKDQNEVIRLFPYLAPALVLLVLAALGWPVLSRALQGKPTGAIGRWTGLACVTVVALVSWGSLLIPFWRPLFHPKFLIFGLPWLHLWAGLGIICLACGARYVFHVVSLPFRKKRELHRVPWAIPLALPTSLPLLSIGLVVFMSLQWYYFDPRYYRDDYRGLAKHIEAQAQPGDAIILEAPGQSEIFSYYYHGQAPVFPLPGQRPMSEIETGKDLESIASGNNRIWGVFWGQRESDPGRFIERWLDENGFKTTDRWFGGIRLVQYAMPGSQENSLPVDARLGDYARLATISLHGSPAAAGGPVARAASGGVIPLTLQWEALASTPQPYKVFVHLLGPQSTLWGQHDAEPAGGSRPTNGWKPGESISDNHGIPVPPGTPPGMYEIEVGLYNMQNGQRLPVFDSKGNPSGDRVVLHPIEITKPAVFPARESLIIERPVDARFGNISLMGYEMFRLGTGIGNRDFRRGDMAHLALFWQVTGNAKPPDYSIRVALLDSAGTELPAGTVIDGYDYPAGRWDPGEIVRAQYKIVLNQPPGAYRLSVSLVSDKGQSLQPAGQGLRLVDGRLLLAEIEIK